MRKAHSTGPPDKRKPLGQLVAAYEYKDAANQNHIRVRRYLGEDGEKAFLQDRWSAKDKRYISGTKGIPRLPYRLPELLEAREDPFGSLVVWIVEGEKDVDTLVARGEVATTNPEGAGKWKPEFAQYFTGLEVRIVADRDTQGREHARDVYKSLNPVAASCVIYECPKGKDVTEHLENGGSLKRLKDVTLAVTAAKSVNGDKPSATSAKSEDPRLSRIVQYGYDQLWHEPPEGRLHNGRSKIAYQFAQQLRDVPPALAEAAMREWWHRLPQENDEGVIAPYELGRALDSLASALSEVPEDWEPGPLAKLVAQAPDRRIAGGEFIFSQPEDPEAVWGEGKRVLWPEGEGIMVTGPQGVGKSTLLQRLALKRIGLTSRHCLGILVRQLPEERRLLYLAMDRPPQIARSFQRMVSPEDRALLDRRMVVWRGALPFDVAREPVEVLAEWCQEQAGEGCDVYCDSYKDLNPALSNEDVGGKINLAVQELLVAGMQWCGAHHHRKASSQNKRPDTLDDVYGSNWLTAGLGSVICLWGKPGSEAVELTHLKQPVDEFGPVSLSHDRVTGRISTLGEANLLEELLRAGDRGLTRGEVALMFYGVDDQNARQKAERKLKALVEENVAKHIPGTRGGSGGGGEPARWFVP